VYYRGRSYWQKKTIGVAVAKDLAAAVEGVLVQVTCGPPLAQLAQITASEAGSWPDPPASPITGMPYGLQLHPIVVPFWYEHANRSAAAR
jgi:hypothetical protein